MARKSKQPPAPVGYYEEDPKDVVFAAMQRKPAGAKWGCFTKEVDDTHVGAFAWFDSQEELIKYIDVWIRCFRTGESPPADWTPPFLVEEDDPNVGAILTEELGARLHEAETMHWAGPVSDIVKSKSEFWRGMRECFLDWGMEEDPPKKMPVLTKAGLLPVKFIPRFEAWVAEYLEC